MTDPRRHVPRTDAVLAEPCVTQLRSAVGAPGLKRAVVEVLDDVRTGRVDARTAPAVAAIVADRLRRVAISSRSVINATGVVLHTNLGRAPLGLAAVEALATSAGYTDVEFDLAGGHRARRGRSTLEALQLAVPEAEDVLVVNNGAAALVLATTTLACGRELVVSRGELVEIGDGFRLPDLIESTGVTLREVGTTNRVTLSDYARVVGERTGAVLKVHPSNFRIEGFTGSVDVSGLSSLGTPVIVDVGSGLLRPHPLLPDEPDVAGALSAGAELVTCSGDKLLGGPQAGLVFGRAATIERLRRHPLARALRIGKLGLAALEATLRTNRAGAPDPDGRPNAPDNPTWRSLSADAEDLRRRCAAIVQLLVHDVAADVVPSAGRVGGGGAPGVELPGWAVALPESLARPLRTGATAVVGRVHDGRLLLDLRCVPADADARVVEAVRAALAGRPG